jgi:dephospho-CoA kinase
VDGDALGWETLQDPEVALAVRERFGAGVVLADGVIDRAALGQIVFRDPAQMARLNAVVQPPLLARVRRTLEAATGDVLVLDAALLTTWRLEPELAGVILVTAPAGQRIDRLRRSRGLSEGEARARILGQALPPVRNARREWIIENDGTIAALAERADAVWSEIEAMEPGEPRPLRNEREGEPWI